jgi:hypothetical protein
MNNRLGPMLAPRLDHNGAIALPCPYCDTTLHLTATQTSTDCTCVKCQKTFLAIIGEVRAVRALARYSAGIVTIRLRNIEGGESVINYRSTHQGNDFRARDTIAVVYQRQWLSSAYRTAPTYIANTNTEIISTAL